MKKIICIIFLLFLIFQSSACKSNVLKESGKSVKFSEKPFIVFVGDEDFEVGKVSPANDYSFMGDNATTYISSYIYDMFRESNPKFINDAKEGIGISQMSEIVSNNALRGTVGPDLLLLQLSDNDAKNYAKHDEKSSGYSPENYKTTLTEMLDKAASKIETVVFIGPYTFENDDFKKQYLQQYIDISSEVAKTYSNVVLIRFQDELDKIQKSGSELPLIKNTKGTEVLSQPLQTLMSSLVLRNTGITSYNKRIVKNAEKEFGGKLTLVCTGDSITDCGRDKEIKEGMYLGNGYASNLNAYLNANYGQEVTVTTVNSGISGNTSSALAGRFRTDVDKYQPDILVMMIGVNDAYNFWKVNDTSSTYDKYKIKLQKMMDDYACDYKKVVLVSPFYAEKHDDSEFRKNFLDEYITAAKETAAKYPNTTFVDMQAIVDSEMEKFNYEFKEITVDKVHLTAYGHKVFTAAVVDALSF